ncbi:hypothetical protein M413DRAFT_22519 [Hebeloma cylindrosporum]|uniref:Uncharacterized protein n=1 Tax=Hebeloma cylindrosporum TaxID=76867 RepID=A0A0C3CUZ0_HEBCY|nr:hypothetical protein M413DRAFT_22519 [Hebeloma cylindrosporum h7]
MSGTSDPNGTTPESPMHEPSNNGQEHSDTQRSLQEASAALEVAYNRIRQVRRSLIELSESLPVSGRAGTNYNGLGPGHDALLLSEASRVEGRREERFVELYGMPFTMPPNRNATPINEPTPPVASDLPSSENPNDSTPFPVDSSTLFQSSIASNVLPPRLSRRDLVNEAQYLQRRGPHQDPSATTRGLRVAAREANAQMTDLSTLSAEYERILALQRDFDLPNVPSLAENSARWERSTRIQRNFDPRDGRRSIPAASVPPPTPPLLSWRTQDSRRWRMRPEVRPPTRPFSAEASDRLQALSNSMMNQDMLAQPPVNVQLPSISTDPRIDPISGFSGSAAEPPRRYRYAMRPVDMENGLNVDWSDEDFISWFSPAQDQYFRDFPTFLPRTPRPQNNAIRATRTTDTAASVSENLPPRRGWARLDPDGNEIPADEEEELERSRTEYRIRALERARQYIGTTQSGGRIANNQRTHYGSVMDSTLNVPDVRQPGSSFPQFNAPRLYVDPLPMPLASMIMSQGIIKQEDDYARDIIVPTHACLAGR